MLVEYLHHTHIFTYKHTHIYIHMYVDMCICMYVEIHTYICVKIQSLYHPNYKTINYKHTINCMRAKCILFVALCL